uniref:Uncharacterized protein n=1 Tax=viral metagenome TaxID=1070528 RepID=A0A6C0EBJ4_9ZZZZ
MTKDNGTLMKKCKNAYSHFQSFYLRGTEQ